MWPFLDNKEIKYGNKYANQKLIFLCETHISRSLTNHYEMSLWSIHRNHGFVNKTFQTLITSLL